MGNVHRDKWYQALPWVMLGKRVQYQPHLDASSSQLVLGKSVKIPGMLVGEPGPPLNSAQTRALLDELYKMADRPPVPTSSRTSKNDLDFTNAATHVYVKQANPQSLCPKFEGPFEITSRPSRSTIQVKIGVYASGEPRLLTLNWSSCKIAHLRDGAQSASRPSLGRPAHSPASSIQQPTADQPQSFPRNKPDNLVNPATSSRSSRVTNDGLSNAEVNKPNRGKFQTHKGPVITEKMFDDADWPKILQIPSEGRPIRSTRNPKPQYTH